MLISKILNNNVVISEENQEEVILMGRGLAFGRKVGQEIPDELIEKKYVLSENRRQLLMELPAEVMEMSDKIISFSREKLQKKLKDTASNAEFLMAVSRQTPAVSAAEQEVNAKA